MYYMIGGAGYHNFGDELMVRCWLQYLKSCGVDENVISVDGASGRALSEALSGQFPNVNYFEVANKISDRGEQLSFWSAVARGFTFYDRGGFERYPQYRSQAARLTDAQIIHIHGGGYLNKHFSRKGFLLGVGAATARRTGAKLIGTGLGLMPLDVPGQEVITIARDALNTFQFIETRDQESAKFLENMELSTEVISGLDDTFSSNVSYTKDGRHRLHVSWNETRVSDERFTGVLDHITRNETEYDEILFWDCARNDRGAWELLHSRFPSVLKMEFSELISGKIPLSPGDHMLTSRFHPHLIGARGGAIGGYLSPGNYYDVKHGSVVALGSGFTKLSGPQVDLDIFNSERNVMFPRMDELLVAKNAVTERVFDLLCLVDR